MKITREELTNETKFKDLNMGDYFISQEWESMGSLCLRTDDIRNSDFTIITNAVCITPNPEGLFNEGETMYVDDNKVVIKVEPVEFIIRY